MYAGKNNNKRHGSTYGPSMIKLGASNFREWREELHIAALQFDEAGQSLRSGIAPIFQEPGRDDRRRLAAPFDLVTDPQFINLLAPQLVGAADRAAEIIIELAFELQFQRIYNSDIAHTEAYKEYRSSVRGLRESTPKLLGFILSSVEDSTKADLRASAVFNAACDTQDIAAVVAEMEVIVGLQGEFSLIATETAYEQLSQAGPPKLSFSEYCNANRELRRQLAALGQPVNPRQATIRFLTRLIRIPGEWDNKINQLFTRLPPVEECQVELQAQQKLMTALAAMRPSTIKPKDQPPTNRPPNDVPAMTFQKQTNATDNDRKPSAKGAPPNYGPKTCYNCDQPLHPKGQKCPAAPSDCKTCKQKGHMTKHHDTFVRIQAKRELYKKENSSGRTSRAHRVTFDEDEDGNYMSWSLSCITENMTLDEDDDEDYVFVCEDYELIDPSNAPTSPPTQVTNGATSTILSIDTGGKPHVGNPINAKAWVSECVSASYGEVTADLTMANMSEANLTHAGGVLLIRNDPRAGTPYLPDGDEGVAAGGMDERTQPVPRGTGASNEDGLRQLTQLVPDHTNSDNESDTDSIPDLIDSDNDSDPDDDSVSDDDSDIDSVYSDTDSVDSDSDKNPGNGTTHSHTAKEDDDSDTDSLPDLINSDDESDDDSDDNDSYDESHDAIHNYVRCLLTNRIKREPLSHSMAAGDTGAEDHVVTDRAMLFDIRGLDANINLVGVGGHRTEVKEYGKLHILDNPTALLMETTDAAAVNLLSMGQIVDKGRYFCGDRTSLRIYDEADDTLILEGTRSPPGFWSFDISPTTMAMPAQLDVFRHLTREQIERAKSVRKLHVSMCHPNDDILGHMLDSHAIHGCPFTSADVRNAASCLGSCLACIKGKYREAKSPTSLHPPAEHIGDNVHCDLIPFECTTIGGYTYGLLMIDEKSAFPHMEGLVSKTSKRIVNAVERAAKFYRRFGHTLRRITPDAEPNFIGATLDLGALASGPIQVTPTLPGRKSKRAERCVQTSKDRMCTLDAEKGFVMPKKLDGEKWVHVLAHLSTVPNSTLNGDVPYTLFTGKPADYNGWVQVPFGRCAYFGPANATDKSLPTLGITLGARWTTETSISVKGYLPSTDSIVVRNVKNVKYVKHNVPAPEWKWPTQESAPAYSTEHGGYKFLSQDAAQQLLNRDTTQSESSPTPQEDVVQSDPQYVPTSPLWQQTILDHDEPESIALPITLEQALNGEHAEDANPAVDDELDNMSDNHVWTAADYAKLSQNDINSAVPSGLYIKYKTNPVDGKYNKSKARLHAGGHKQHADHFSDTASFMVNMMIVFITIKLMTALNWAHAVFDIKGAFLHAPRTHAVPQYMKLTPKLTALWIKKHPDDAQFVHNGSLYVLLHKALYGLKDSGRLWYDHLTKFLLSIGFIICASDPCMYCKWNSATDFAYVLTHVDDLFLVGLGAAFSTFKGLLTNTFPDVSEQINNTFTYLGMTIIRQPDDHSTTINQRSYIQTMLQTFGMMDCTPVASPSTADLLHPKEDTSAPCDKTLFLSIVMSLMYLARISRPDVLFVVTFLATKSAKPTELDLTAVKRVLRYLKGTINLALRFIGKSINLVVFADASHGVHPDGKGQYSTVIHVGGDEIIRTSNKMKCVTLSSTESEIMGAVDAATYFRWLIRLFQEFHQPVELPIELKQDNLSAMHMIRHGPNFRRAKHMLIKGEFVRELELDGTLKMVATPSEDMDADAYTKDYRGRQLVKYTLKHFVELDD